MKKTKGLFSILVLASFCLLTSGNIEAAAAVLAAPLGNSLGGLPTLGAAELLKRYFHTEIQPKLFPGWSFMNRAINDDAFVDNDSVQLAHSGANPAAQVDRSIIPAQVTQRTDQPTEYRLEELTTDPTVIKDSEAMVVAYDKRASVTAQHASTINTLAADRCAYKWAAGASGTHILKTTGATRAASGPSQTGNRNKLTLADFIKIRQLFFDDDIVNENGPVGGCCLLTPAMYGDLLGIPELIEAQKFGSPILPQGVIARLLDFDIYVRSRVVVYDNSDALKAQGAAAAATDQNAAIFWRPDMVRRAKGSLKTYVNPDQATMYGSVYSVMQRFGALAARNDNKGIVTIMEDNG